MLLSREDHGRTLTDSYMRVREIPSVGERVPVDIDHYLRTARAPSDEPNLAAELVSGEAANTLLSERQPMEPSGALTAFSLFLTRVSSGLQPHAGDRFPVHPDPV